MLLPLLLGTTQRYMHLSPAALGDAIKLLDSLAVLPSRGEILQNLPEQDDNAVKQKQLGGVGDGVRTRDFRSHSPALCH